MTTLRSTEDFSWNFSEDPLGEVDPQVDDPEAVYKQLMTDGALSENCSCSGLCCAWDDLNFSNSLAVIFVI